MNSELEKLIKIEKLNAEFKKVKEELAVCKSTLKENIIKQKLDKYASAIKTDSFSSTQGSSTEALFLKSLFDKDKLLSFLLRVRNGTLLHTSRDTFFSDIDTILIENKDITLTDVCAWIVDVFYNDK